MLWQPRNLEPSLWPFSSNWTEFHRMYFRNLILSSILLSKETFDVTFLMLKKLEPPLLSLKHKSLHSSVPFFTNTCSKHPHRVPYPSSSLSLSPFTWFRLKGALKCPTYYFLLLIFKLILSVLSCIIIITLENYWILLRTKIKGLYIK